MLILFLDFFLLYIYIYIYVYIFAHVYRCSKRGCQIPLELKCQGPALERGSEEGVSGSSEKKKKDSKSNSEFKLATYALLETAFQTPPPPLRQLSLAILKILWIAHLLQIKSPDFYLKINSAFTPGSFSIIPWISIPWPQPTDSFFLSFFFFLRFIYYM